jgi:hypothetical protein
VPHHQVAAGLPDVDAVVGVGGVARDPLVFLVEGVHGPPAERDPLLELAGVPGQAGVLPGATRGGLPAGPDRVPGHRAEAGVICGVPAGLEYAAGDGGEREIGDRVAARLMQQGDVLAVGDPLAAEPHAHPPAQRLGEQHPLGQRAGHQEPAGGSGGERSLLPGQSHDSHLTL